MDPLSQLFAESDGTKKSGRSGIFGDSADAKRLFSKIWEDSGSVSAGPTLTPVPPADPKAKIIESTTGFMEKALGALVAPNPEVALEIEEVVHEDIEQADEDDPVLDDADDGVQLHTSGIEYRPTSVTRESEPVAAPVDEELARSIIEDALVEHTGHIADVVTSHLEGLISSSFETLAESAATSAADVDKKIDSKLADLIKTELPKVIREELKGIVGNEVIKAVAAAIPKESSDKLSKMEKALNRMTAKFEAIEPRMSKIEGAMEAMGREIVFNVPENAFNFTMPEREMTVKVDAPNVNFGKDAFNMNFHRNGDKSKKGIEFKRDRDNNITSAEIVDGNKSASKTEDKAPIHPDVAEFMPKREQIRDV